MLENVLDRNCVGGFETSNISNGHSTHHQGEMQLICWKRVLRFIFIEAYWEVTIEEREEDYI